MQKLVHKLSHQRDIKIDFRKIPGADHFFADSAEALANACRRLYRRRMRRFAEPAEAAAATRARPLGAEVRG